MTSVISLHCTGVSTDKRQPPASHWSARQGLAPVGQDRLSADVGESEGLAGDFNASYPQSLLPEGLKSCSLVKELQSVKSPGRFLCKELNNQLVEEQKVKICSCLLVV